MMTRHLLGRIGAMAITGAALALGTAWSFGVFAPPPEPAACHVVALKVDPPCTRGAAHGIFVHVRRHLARHLHRV